MPTRTEIMKDKIYASGMKLSEIAKKAGISRQHIYNLMDHPNVSLEVVLKIGKAIHYDFSDDIPELKKLKKLNILEDPAGEYVTREELKTIVSEEVSDKLSEKDDEIRYLKEIIRLREQKIQELELEIRRLQMGQKKTVKEYIY